MFLPRPRQDRIAMFIDILVHDIATFPIGTENAPYLSELVPSSLTASASDSARFGPYNRRSIDGDLIGGERSHDSKYDF